MPGAQDVLSANKATAVAGIQAFVEGLMREDKKLTILKTLQVLSHSDACKLPLMLLTTVHAWFMVPAPHSHKQPLPGLW